MEALMAKLSDGARKRQKVTAAPSSALVTVARLVAPTRTTGDGLRQRLTALVQKVPAEAPTAGAVQLQGKDARERNTPRPLPDGLLNPTRTARAGPHVRDRAALPRGDARATSSATQEV